MGYSAFGDISNGLSFGLGCVLSKYTGRNISVDYSFSPTYSFGDVHKLSVTYKFGEKRETLDSLAAEKAAVDMSLGPSSLAPEKTPSEYYLDIFNNGTLVQRRNAIAELGARGGEDSFKLLIGILKDSNPWIIRDAVLVLSKLDDKRVIAPLIELLKSDEEPIRMAAISGLARYKDPQVFAALVGCMDDKSPDVRVWAAEVLAKRTDPGAVEAIQAALKKEKDEKVRSSMMDYVRILDPSLQVN
jgi:HEAT repeat protein